MEELPNSSNIRFYCTLLLLYNTKNYSKVKACSDSLDVCTKRRSAIKVWKTWQ